MKKRTKANADPHMLCQATKWGPLEGLKPGDRVAYTAAFVRSIGMCGATAGRRGTFVSRHPDIADWALVQWDDEDEPQAVSFHALAVPGANQRFAQPNG